MDWDQWHYQFNDLGTVLAATDAQGLKIGVYQPDAFGNERLVDGMRPDGLMLTGKFRDAEAGLIYFGYRWYDAERGRWMSEEPLGFDGPNLYIYVFNSPHNIFDLTGLRANYPDWWNPFDWVSYGFLKPMGNWIRNNITKPALNYPNLLNNTQVLANSVNRTYGLLPNTTQYADANQAIDDISEFSEFCPKALAASIGISRVAATTLAEQLVLQEARAGAGTIIMSGKIRDPRFPEDLWEKVQHVHKNPDGSKIVIHYWRNKATKELKDFKFKNP